MKVEVDLHKCHNASISTDEYVLLWLMYHKEWKLIEKLFTRPGALAMRNRIKDNTDFILSKSGLRFKETVLGAKARKLMGLSKSGINFDEWWILIPPRVGTRVFRTKAASTTMYNKLKHKYELKVTTGEEHADAVKGTENMIANHRRRNSMQFLPNPERIINNCMWEQYVDDDATHTTNVKQF